MTFVIVRGFITLDFALSSSDSLLEVFLLVVEFVLQGQEMLVKRDAVTQERFIARGLVLLIDFTVLEQLDLLLHGGDLLVKIEDDILMDGLSFSASFLVGGERTNFICGLLEV